MFFVQQDRDQIIRQTENELPPKTYFNLIEKVGDSGRYQFSMLLIFMLCWFITGIILFSAPFLFRNRRLECRANGLTVSNRECISYVCQLPEDQWSNFLGVDDNSYSSIATNEKYLCKQSATIDFLSSCPYIGALVGYFVISFFADNFGRRISLLASWGLCTLGTIIVAVGFNVYIIAVGLFLSGCGCDVAINITFCLFAETVGNKKRQKYSVIVQMFFTIGALVMTLFYYIIDSWRINWCFFVAAPSLIALILIFSYIQQTPHYLIKQGVISAMDALNRVGKINLDRRQTLQQEDIESVIEYQTVDFQDKYITIIDLFKFSSLRNATISCIILASMISAMYYGPALIISHIGFNIYVNNIIIQLPQLLIFLPAYLCVQHVERIFFGKIFFLIAVIISLVLAFISQPAHCDLCTQNIISLVLVFLFRGCIAIIYVFFQIYCYQLFPSMARALGFGTISAVGALAAALNPLYIGALHRNGVNVKNFFWFFAFFGVIAIVCLTFLPQTKQLKLREEMQEIEYFKQRKEPQHKPKGNRFLNRKLQSQLSLDNSFNDKGIRSD